MELKDKQLSDAELNDYIDKYLDGLLSEDEMDEFETKCLEDKSFFEKVRERELFTQKVAEVIHEEGEEIFEEYLSGDKIKKTVKPPESLIDKLKQFWSGIRPIWRFSLIPAGVVAVLVLVMFLPPDPYKPDPALESLTESFRGSESIEIVSPPNNANLDEEVQFHWKNDSRNPVEFILLNNQGKEIETKTSDNLSETFSLKLDPGLYYWKLVDARGNMIVSKFTVGKK